MVGRIEGVGRERERRIKPEYFIVIYRVEFIVCGAGDAGCCVLVCEAKDRKPVFPVAPQEI